MFGGGALQSSRGFVRPRDKVGRRRQHYVVACVLIVAFAVVASLVLGDPSLPEGDRLSLPAGPAPSVPTDQSSMIARERVAEPAVSEQPELVLYQGRVRDERTHVPLLATVRVGRHAFRTSGTTGQFDLALPADGNLTLHVAASGYTPRLIEVGGGSSSEDILVELVAACTVRLVVVDRGLAPASDAEVFAAAHSRDRNGHRRLVSLGRTDTRGELDVQVGLPLIIFACCNERVSGLAAISPDTRRQIIQIKDPRIPFLGITSPASGGPQASLLSLRSIDPLAPASFELETDADGVCRQPLPATVYEVEVSAAGSRARSWVDCVASGCRLHRGKTILSLVGSGSDVRWIVVDSGPVRLVEVLDQRRRPIPSIRMRLEAIEERIDVPQPWQRVGTSAVLADDRGVYDANYVLPAALRHLGQTRLRVSVSGYADAFLYDPFNSLSASSTQVQLEEDPTCKLRLMNGSSPLLRNVAICQVRDGEEEVLIVTAIPSPLGIVEYHSAPESDISIRLGSESGPLISKVKASVALIDVQVDCSASLVVDCSDDAAEIVCAIGSWEPSCQVDSSGRLIFKNLPPGSYDVGSRERVSAARLSRAWALDVESVSLASGEQKTLRVSASVGQLAGQCQVVGAQEFNVRVSVRGGGAEAGPFAFGPADIWTSVGADGRFFVSGSVTRDPWVAYALVGAEGVAIPLGLHRLSEQPVFVCRQLHVRVDNKLVMPTSIRIPPAQDQLPSLAPSVEWLLVGSDQEFLIPDLVERIEVVNSESIAVVPVQKGLGRLIVVVRQGSDGKLGLEFAPR